MVKQRHVEWHPKTRKLMQIPKEGLEYALVSDDYQQIHQLAWCRDFIPMAIYSHLKNNAVHVYGFRYYPNEDPQPCLSETRIMVTNWKDTLFSTRVEWVLDLLNQVEDHLKIKKSVIEKVSKHPWHYNKSGVWLFRGSKRWMKSPPMLSLYTFLIRLGMVHQVGDHWSLTLNDIKRGIKYPYNWKPDRFVRNNWHHDSNDSDYLMLAWDGIMKIMKYGDRKIFHKDIKENYCAKDYITNERMQTESGILAFSEGKTEKYFPHWHRLPMRKPVKKLVTK